MIPILLIVRQAAQDPGGLAGVLALQFIIAEKRKRNMK